MERASRAGFWVFAGVAFFGLVVSASLAGMMLMLGDRSFYPWLMAAGVVVTLAGAGAAAWIFGEWEKKRLERMSDSGPVPIFLPTVISNPREDRTVATEWEAALDGARRRSDETRLALDGHLRDAAERTARLIEQLVEISRLRDEGRSSQRVADDAARGIVDRTAQARTTAKFIETQAESTNRAAARMNDALGRLRWVGRDSAPILDDIRELAHAASALAVTASVEAARGGEGAAPLHALADELREWARAAKDAVHTTQDVLRESDQLFNEGEQAAQNLRNRLDDFAAGVGMVNRVFEDIPSAQREYARLREPVLRADLRADDVLREALEAARADAVKLTGELGGGDGRRLMAEARVERAEADATDRKPGEVGDPAVRKRIGLAETGEHADPADFLPLDDADDGTGAE